MFLKLTMFLEKFLTPALVFLDLKVIRNRKGKIWLPQLIKRSSFLIEVKRLISDLRPVTNGHHLVRIGDGDGGYLVPDDLLNIEGCFSAGSDKIMVFESHLADVYGIKSHILDKLEKKPEELSDFQEFRNGWLSTFNGTENVTLKTWVDETNLKDSLYHNAYPSLPRVGSGNRSSS